MIYTCTTLFEYLRIRASNFTLASKYSLIVLKLYMYVFVIKGPISFLGLYVYICYDFHLSVPKLGLFIVNCTFLSPFGCWGDGKENNIEPKRYIQNQGFHFSP